jgi:PEP-CTERM motif
MTNRGFGVCTALALLAVGLFASASQAQTSDNLLDLVNTKGSLTIGDKVFSNFSFQESGLTSFDPSQITVTASFSNGIYSLTWGGNLSLVSGAGSPASADLLLKYTVTAATGLIDTIDASYTGSAQPSGAAFIAIDETARDPNGNVVGSTHLDAQQRSDSFAVTPPQSQLNVTKDIAFGIVDGGFVTVSEVSQSFHQVQVPEPGTVSLIVTGLGLSGVAFLRRRHGK